MQEKRIQHKAKVEYLRNEIKNVDKIVFQRENSCRFNLESKESKKIDNSNFNEIIGHVDNKLIVEPNVTMEQIVDYCLQYSFLPPIITEFKHMTIGGSISGGGAESGSFKYGFIHEQVLQYEVLDGNADIHIVTKNDDLYGILPFSYGTVGIITCIELSCIPIKPNVVIDFKRFKSVEEVTLAFSTSELVSYYDFIDGVAMSRDNFIIMFGKFTESTTCFQSFNKRYDPWFYNFILKQPNHSSITMSLKDYIFRWDRGAFFNVSMRCKDTLFNRMTMFDEISCEKLYKRARRRSVIERESRKLNQDMMIPIDKFKNFFYLNHELHESYPMWILPIKTHMDTLFAFKKNEFVIDVGTYGYSKKQPFDFVKENKQLEDFLYKNGGKKCLWNQSYYSEKEFWLNYDRKSYEEIREIMHLSKKIDDIHKKTCSMYLQFEDSTIDNMHKVRVDRVANEIKKCNSFYSIERKKINYSMHHEESEFKKRKDQKIDMSDFNHILKIDPIRKIALVEPNVTIYELVKKTLEYNLIPLVIPELKSLSIGGLVQGAGLESSSFKYGQFNDSCEEYNIILGNGEISTASNSENEDLFQCMSGSMGTLCTMTSIVVKLQPASSHITMTYYSFSNLGKALELMLKCCNDIKFDFIEGFVLKDKTILALGQFDTKHDHLPFFDKNPQGEWFIEHLENIDNDYFQEQMTMEEYLFRHDQGAFWTGMYARWKHVNIGTNKFLRKKLYNYFDTNTLWAKLYTKPMNEREKRFILQDCYVNYDQVGPFVEKCNNVLGIYPLWLCPVKNTESMQLFSPHFNIKNKFSIDVGIWGVPTKFPFPFDGIKYNRIIEKWLEGHNGRKMLYGKCYHTLQEFQKIYPHRDIYDCIRKKYHSSERLIDIYTKLNLK